MTFEEAIATIPIEQRCFQNNTGEFQNWNLNHCFFGIPQDPLYGLSPLSEVPLGATAFHFYLGEGQASLLKAFLQSGYAETVEALFVGNSSFKMGKYSDYSELVSLLSNASLPKLKHLSLGVWQLFSNSHCMYGYLGDITSLLGQLPELEELFLFGNFELTKPLSLNKLKIMDILLDDPITGMNGGCISNTILSNVLDGDYPQLEKMYIDLDCDVDVPVTDYAFTEKFLAKESTPTLSILNILGYFNEEEQMRFEKSKIKSDSKAILEIVEL